jgi:hypothetical protein
VGTLLPVSLAGQEYFSTIRSAYCDTDTVIHLHKPSIHPDKCLDEGPAIGCWGIDGVAFVALAPECYCLVFDRRNKKGKEHTIKSKGVAMTHDSRIHIMPEMYERLILDATRQALITCRTLQLHARGAPS